MKNEIEKRKEGKGNLLYEPIEPLFPEFKKRRVFMVRIVALLLVAATVACIWTIVASGKGDGDEKYIGAGDDIYESESGRNTEVESDSIESDISEDEGISESESEAEVETESDTEDSLPQIIGVDLSELERGLAYVINYSGKRADVSGLLDRGFFGEEKRGDGAPVVLVIHTHTGEEYQSGDTGYRGPVGVVSVGDVLVSRLNSLGVGAIHCSVIHDGKGENAYRNTEETIKLMREIYPSLKYIIDIHRMELYEGEDLVKTVSGCRDGSAQIRLTVRTDETGDAWQEELSLALELRRELNRGGERVCMPTVITPGIAGLDMGELYIMAEVGALGNTVEEAMAAGERLACAIADVLID